mmetsp:Transcript_15773/g.39649  ORF Transcript_15773/g.39649 Transcript_15773/m.39649 type:complete len:239 (-) Transcript_15773:96-812(-)
MPSLCVLVFATSSGMNVSTTTIGSITFVTSSSEQKALDIGLKSHSISHVAGSIADAFKASQNRNGSAHGAVGVFDSRNRRDFGCQRNRRDIIIRRFGDDTTTDAASIVGVNNECMSNQHVGIRSEVKSCRDASSELRIPFRSRRKVSDDFPRIGIQLVGIVPVSTLSLFVLTTHTRMNVNSTTVSSSTVRTPAAIYRQEIGFQIKATSDEADDVIGGGIHIIPCRNEDSTAGTDSGFT